MGFWKKIISAVKRDTPQSDEGKDNDESTMENVALTGAAYENVQRHGSAVKEHAVAYSGVDNETGKQLTKSLKGISGYKVNPKDHDRNIKQQAGFTAEVKEVARENAERIIKGDKTRASRTDDIERRQDPRYGEIGGTNEGLYDIAVIDEHGNIIDASQMKFVGKTSVYLGWRNQYIGVYTLRDKGVAYYFIDNEQYFLRDRIYGHFDDGEKYAYFSKAIVKFLELIKFEPDILHLNDWQTALTPIYLKSDFRDFEPTKNSKTIFTIHNMKFQGRFSSSMLDSCLGLGWEWFNLDGIEYYGDINYMKSALLLADSISTVSKRYAAEIKYPFFGEGLDGIINARSNVLYGILNGIDDEYHDPAKNDKIFANFSADDISGKAENKTQLRKVLSLSEEDGDVPIISVVSRLTGQKGLDLIERMITELMKEDLQLAILGTGDPGFEDFFRNTASMYEGKLSVNIVYNDILAERMYAGSDIFLMPSLFEPCGLSQLFAMKYGTIPIVRETGGLYDTVVPYDEETGNGNGFSFVNYNAHDMFYTIKRALDFYKKKDIWEILVKRNMSYNFGWDKSADEYIRMYEETLARP